MTDKIARVWNGTEWVVVSSPVGVPNSIAVYQGSPPTTPTAGQLWIDSDNPEGYFVSSTVDIGSIVANIESLQNQVANIESLQNQVDTKQKLIPYQSSPPSTPSSGDYYVNSDENMLYVWSGASWSQINQNQDLTILKLNCINNANINDTETWTLRSIYDTPTAEINQGGFTFTNSGITIPEDGIYQCIFNFFIVAPDTTEYRMNPGARWNINSTLQNEIAASSYIRSENGHDEASLHLSSVFQLSSGDVLSVYWSKLAGTDIDVVLQGSNSNVQIIKIG